MEFRERITRYRSTMEEISKQLSTIDNRNDHSPELISNVILNQHSTFMSLASNVANLHSELDQLKKDYTQWYQVCLTLEISFSLFRLSALLSSTHSRVPSLLFCRHNIARYKTLSPCLSSFPLSEQNLVFFSRRL
jgi:hypothetical protein